MILECDIGNTRIKWRLLAAGGEVASRGCVDSIDELMRLALPAPARVRVASVAGEDAEQQLRQWLQREYALQPEFARTQASCGPVRNSYSDPSRIGVDRWLAILAAHALSSGPALVIDAGTALTLDYVTADGEHLGGFILPGARLMRKALFGDTRRVRFDDEQSEDLYDTAPGRSTVEAVNHGIQLASNGIVEQAVGRAMAWWGEDFRLLLTGGDGERLAAAPAAQRGQLVPELVLDGLAVAMP